MKTYDALDGTHTRSHEGQKKQSTYATASKQALFIDTFNAWWYLGLSIKREWGKNSDV